MIYINFVKSDLIGSRTIRWGLNNKSSHMAIEFPELAGIVYHSYGRGINIETNEIFYKTYDLVDRIEISNKDSLFIHNLFSKKVGKIEYDYPGLLYLAYSGILYKFFNQPLPKINPLEEDNKYLCTELIYPFIETLEELTGQNIPFSDQIAAMTPDDVCKYLKGIF